MSNEARSQRELTEKIDQVIRERIQKGREADDQGYPIAAVPASDKYSLAKQVGVEMEDVQERLEAICDEVTDRDGYAAVPRYRLRPNTCDPH
jgi:hypothetical protein